MTIGCPYSGEPCPNPAGCLVDGLLRCAYVNGTYDPSKESPVTLNVVDFPRGNVQDIPRGLRELADSIEAGKFGQVHNLCWVIDSEGKVELGMLGRSREEIGAEAHLMLGAAQAKLVKDCL